MDAFAGSEDFEPGRDPVEHLTLREQLEYWKTRARLAEESLHDKRECPSPANGAEAEESDPADWWKKFATD